MDGAYAAASQDLWFTTNLVTYETTLLLTHLQTTCADSLHRVETPPPAKQINEPPKHELR